MHEVIIKKVVVAISIDFSGVLTVTGADRHPPQVSSLAHCEALQGRVVRKKD